MPDGVVIALCVPKSELLERGRSLYGAKRRVLLGLVLRIGEARTACFTESELASDARTSVAVVRAVLGLLCKPAPPCSFAQREAPLGRGYPPCRCGRPLFPHEDGGVCCVGCGRLVVACDGVVARARAAAASDRLAPLRGAFLAPEQQ